jgi:probable F420-dependent oxidoreductase
MQFGLSLSMEWLVDVDGLRRAAVAADAAGVDYLTTSGHLLTAAPGRYPRMPPATYSLAYREPFVLFSHLAAVTRRISFRTAILILPMLPTVLVAKQAADVSLLSGGRLQLGVGISWQEVEYRALGQEMRDRGRKLEEQIEVLRLLWTQPQVTFKGRYHDLDGVGLGQVPEEPIPIWFGSAPEARQLRRAAELGDGWMPGGGLSSPDPVRQLRGFAADAGRTDGIAVTGRVVAGPDAGVVAADAQRQVDAGATETTLAAPPGASPDEGTAAVIAARDNLQDALG